VIDPELRERLDEVQVSKIAEYLAERVELEQGETMLQIEFKQGRYQRLQRLVEAPVRDLREPLIRSLPFSPFPIWAVGCIAAAAGRARRGSRPR
jgi:hypothetical protein